MFQGPILLGGNFKLMYFLFVQVQFAAMAILLVQCLAMPSSCIWSSFSRCPFLTPFDHLSKGKRGTCKNPQQNKKQKQRLQCKQHLNTFTTFRAHASQCLLDVFGTFFQGALFWPLSQPKQRKTGTCKNLQQDKETKTKGYNANITSTFTTFRAHALQCLLHVFGAFVQGALFWPPLIT